MMAPITVLKNVCEMIIFSIVLAIVSKTVEGKTILENTKGYISSPNFPNPYPNDFLHVWEIHAPKGYRIKLVFHSLNLEVCSSCNCDYVDIHNGDGNADLLGRICNRTITTFQSTHHMMTIKFNTDSSVQKGGFSATYRSVFDFEASIPKGTQGSLIYYLLYSRQQTNTINKWGTDITRTAVALHLHDPQFLVEGYGEEITYELTLQLMSKLVMKKQIFTKDLALFVNAMTVACINPEKFFGLNIVAELRRRVDNDNLTNPFIILSLCNAGGNMTMEDILKLQLIFDAHLRPSWTGTQAIVVMALECISRKLHIHMNTVLDEMVSQIKRKQQNNGTVENLKTTALVIQALMATDRYETNFNMSMAIKSLVNDLRNSYLSLSTEEFYHILPISKGKTLLDISSIHCGNFTETDFHEVKTTIQKHPDERIQIQISVIIGDDMDFTRTWRIKIPPNYSFYQALENIGSSDSHFKVQYTILEGKPYIAGLASYKDSTEDGLFWFIYTKQISSNHDPVLVEESPADIPVSVTDELILWYRSVPCHIAQEITTDASSTDIPFTEITDYPLNFTDV